MNDGTMNNLTLALPVVVPLLLAGLKALAPRLPKAWLPWAAPLLGAVLQIGDNYFGGGAMGTATAASSGALAGLVGIGLREIQDQTRQAMGSGVRALVPLLVMGLVGLGMSACAVQYGADGSIGVFPGTAPSDEVQTLTVSSIGVSISGSSTTGNGMPEIVMGYKRAQMTRVPGFDQGTLVPSVSTSSKADANTGATVDETLEVSTYESPEEEPDSGTTAGP